MSTISTTVAPSFASVNFASGRANPTRRSVSASANRIAGTYRRAPGEPVTMFGSSAGDDHCAARPSRRRSSQT